MELKSLFSYSKIPVTSWYLTVELDKDTVFKEINNKVIQEIILYFVILANYFTSTLFCTYKNISTT